MSPKLKNNPHVFALITILCWSLAYVFTRMTLVYFSPLSLGLLRYVVASAVLLALVLVLKIAPPKRRDMPSFIVAGACGFFFYMIFFNLGTVTVTAATSSIIIATSPIITAFLARFFLGEQLQPRQWIAILISFGGVLYLTLADGFLSVNVGILWLLLAAVVLSVYNLIQRRLTSRYSSLQSSIYAIFWGTAMLFIFTPQAVRDVAAAPPIQLVYIIIMGVFSSALAYLAWSKALALAENTSQVGNYMFLNPFTTALLGFVALGEKIEMTTIIGGVGILLGVFIFNYGKTK